MNEEERKSLEVLDNSTFDPENPFQEPINRSESAHVISDALFIKMEKEQVEYCLEQEIIRHSVRAEILLKANERMEKEAEAMKQEIKELESKLKSADEAKEYWFQESMKLKDTNWNIVNAIRSVINLSTKE